MKVVIIETLVIISSALLIVSFILYLFILNTDQKLLDSACGLIKRFWLFVERSKFSRAPEYFIKSLPFISYPDKEPIPDEDEDDEDIEFIARMKSQMSKMRDKLDEFRLETDSELKKQYSKELSLMFVGWVGEIELWRKQSNTVGRYTYISIGVILAALGSLGLIWLYPHYTYIDQIGMAVLILLSAFTVWSAEFSPFTPLDFEDMEPPWKRLVYIVGIQSWLFITIEWAVIAQAANISYSWLLMFLAFIMLIVYLLYGCFAPLYDFLMYHTDFVKDDSRDAFDVLVVPFSIIAWFGFSYVATLATIALGIAIKPSDPIPASWSMLTVNAVSDGLTFWISVKILSWAVSSNRFVGIRIGAAIMADIFWSAILACSSLYIGLTLSLQEISKEDIWNVFLYRGLNGENFYFGTYAWVMHTAFLPTFLLILVIGFLWIIASPSSWFIERVLKKAHASSQPLESLVTSLAILGGFLGSIAGIIQVLF